MECQKKYSVCPDDAARAVDRISIDTEKAREWSFKFDGEQGETVCCSTAKAAVGII